MTVAELSPEIIALAEAQAAQDRELLAALVERDGPIPFSRQVALRTQAKRNINLAIRPKRRKAKRK